MRLLDNRLPDLVIPYPQCGHCGKDVTIEDGQAWCEGCLIQWDEISEDAKARPDENEDGADVPCQMGPERPVSEYDHQGKRVKITRLRCILPSGHESEHLHPYGYESTPLSTPTPESGEES